MAHYDSVPQPSGSFRVLKIQQILFVSKRGLWTDIPKAFPFDLLRFLDRTMGRETRRQLSVERTDLLNE